MKAIAAYIFALAGIATAHYTFPRLIVDGVNSADWEFIRRTINHQTTDFTNAINDVQIRCFEDPGRPQAQIAKVTAGSFISFNMSSIIVHPGPVLFYMAKAPAEKSAADWDGAGKVWFKISEMAPKVSDLGLTWESDNHHILNTTLPASLPDGDYLLRVEHIALHSARYIGATQFYLACAQLTVSGGGDGTPGPLVAFPGAYSPTDPGILIHIDWPIPTDYAMPGPPVWKG